MLLKRVRAVSTISTKEYLKNARATSFFFWKLHVQRCMANVSFLLITIPNQKKRTRIKKYLVGKNANDWIVTLHVTGAIIRLPFVFYFDVMIIITKIDITIFITLIWKSVEIHANCLALTDAMKSRIAPFFLLIASFSQPIRKLYWNTTNQISRLLYKVTNQISGKWKTTFATFYELAQKWINKIFLQTI